MNKNSLLLLVAIFALAAGLLTQRMLRTSSAFQETAKVVNFSLPDVSAEMQAISQWRGKVLVINFWATWCAPCLKEIPEFVRLQAEFQAVGLQFVGVSIEDRPVVADFIKGNPINYPMLIAGDAGIGLARQLGNIINAVPFTVIVDQTGQIVHRQPGELSRQQLLEIVKPLIAVN